MGNGLRFAKLFHGHTMTATTAATNTQITTSSQHESKVTYIHIE